jgi:hypothetical protein
MGAFDFTPSGGPKGWIPLRLCPFHAELLGRGDKYVTITMLDEDYDSPRRNPDEI